MMTLLDGKTEAQAILNKLKHNISSIEGRKPLLVSVEIGTHPEAASYIRQKEKLCSLVGMHSRHLSLNENLSSIELKNTLDSINQDPKIDGIILQMPLPAHIDMMQAISWINPEKDVDGIHPYNLGKLMHGKAEFIPATPLAVIQLLKSCMVPLAGKKAMIIGRSLIVGKPLCMLLLSMDCTVMVAHSKSNNLVQEASMADILIVAVGKAHMVRKEYIKKDAIVIDVGINYVDGRLTGDVAFDEVAPLASYISPVPGGVGSLTTAMLLNNTWKAFLLHLCP